LSNLIIKLNNFIFYINKSKNLFFYKLKNKSLFSVVRLPFFYIMKSTANNIIFFFFSKFFYKTFLRNFLTGITRSSAIYSFKMKLKGLGFRVKKFSSCLYRFFFNMVNFFYFHVPQTLIFKKYRRFLLFVGFDLQIFRSNILHILLLFKLIPYKIRGLTYPREIIWMKPGKKKF
jgi:hypothetical protein